MKNCDGCGKFTSRETGWWTECGTAWICPSCRTEQDEMNNDSWLMKIKRIKEKADEIK